MKERIKQLVEAYGPSGFESQVIELIKQMIEGYVDQMEVDALGSLIAVKKGKNAAKKVMFSAHADEIGVVVTHIDDKGFLRFANVGGLYPATLLGNRVRFANGAIGVIGREKGEPNEIKMEKMFIDIGASSKEEAGKKVSVGDFAIMDRQFADLGNRIVAKSMDDRIGCAVLIEALLQLEDCAQDTYFVFSSQEEVGLRGAKTSAFRIEPDLGIALDVTLTGDTPEAPTMDVSLGGGAAIKVKDSSMITQPKVKELLVKLAQDNGIKYQLEVLERGGTDAGAIQLSRAGVPAGTISIPCRYVHTTSEMVDIGDVQACIDLVKAVAQTEV